ncbi:hypothetical protein ACH47X_21720 [Promicromonospora kroppenstedtii]|uniref:ABC transporter permease n=1 Tax=Promicromonospora kroppenstedtii TaxID=440482 RepID=A0ABW7XQH0_9MICO
MTTPGPPADQPHWRVYPMNFTGSLVNGAINALAPFLLGTGASFVLLLAVAMVGEEALSGMPAVSGALDQLARAGMLPVLVLALGAGVVTTVLLALREVITSRALVRAAREGAPRTAVPHPSQVDLVTAQPPFLPFLVMSVLVAGIGLLMAVVAAFTVNGSELPILWGFLVATGVGGVFVLLALAGRPAHHRRRLEIAAHWTTTDEHAAWRRAAPARPADDHEAELPPDLQRLRRRATWYEYVGIVCFALGFSLMQLWLFVTHPFRSMTDAGPRVEHGAGVEVVLVAGVWVFAALMVVAVALLVVGFFADSAVQRREQEILREALADPDARRPQRVLLRKYADHQPVVFAQALALLAALGTTLGWAVYSLGTGGMSDVATLYGDADETFGGFVPQALVTLGGSVAVVVAAVVWDGVAAARGDELRGRVVERWPVKPAPRMIGEDGKKRPDPATTGPSLTPKPPKPRAARR